MKNLSFLLLLFFIHCSSQQKLTDKKYMNMEAMIQKYHDIKTRYDSFIEKNKEGLIYENGAYFKKSLYEKEAKEQEFEPQKSESKFLLKEHDKAFFTKDQGQSVMIYTYQEGQLIETATVEKKNSAVYFIDNLIEGTAVRYDSNKNKMYLSHYIQDEYDVLKRDIILDQEFENNKLVFERNYKKDFKISQGEMLKALPNNFYNSSLDYLMREYKDKYEKYIEEEYKRKALPNEIEKIVEDRAKRLKEKLKTAIETKNDFYKKINIYKTYNNDHFPIYRLTIYETLESTNYWEIDIDGKTNKILLIELEIPNA